ncbi:MAG: ribosome maturation factor RimP [Ignavibacterium sp.]
MNPIEKKILQICEEVTQENGVMLIDVVFRGQGNSRVIEVFIDDEKKLNVEKCADVSRKIVSVLNEEEDLDFNFRLDVSSPGVDRPLKFLQQYPKHIGRQFEVHFIDENDVEKNFFGKLKEVYGEDLIFVIGKNEIKLNFDKITKAKVKISF